MRWVLVGLIALTAISAAILLRRPAANPAPQVVPVTAVPTTIPIAATRPATKAAPIALPAKPKDYLDVVRLAYPDVISKPLAEPLALSASARFIITDPIYLDTTGALWITRSDAELTSEVLKVADRQHTHVTRESVCYVHRWPDASGAWQLQLICRQQEGRYEVVSSTSREPLSSVRNYDWDHAFSWNESIVVPSDRGISIIRTDPKPAEIYHEFIASAEYGAGKFSQVQALLDWRGVIAWMPWEDEKSGSKGAARFLNNRWTVLDAQSGWPEKLLHLVPMGDGSVIRLGIDSEKNVEVTVDALDPANVEEKRVDELVSQLSNADSNTRISAYNQLLGYGSGIWKLLEKKPPVQSADGEKLLARLLDSKQHPTVGGMILHRSPVLVLARGTRGSVMLFSDGGVGLRSENAADPVKYLPAAWLGIQPGRSIELPSQAMIDELQGKKIVLRSVRGGEYVISDETDGPRWWMANHFSEPLLRNDERDFKEPIGMDFQGRWLFRKSLADSSPTLIIDPTLPDPSPKLPIWIFHVDGGSSGRTPDNWPAVKNGGAWALLESGWKVIDEEKEKFIAANGPTTSPTSAPAVKVAIIQPILTESDGTRFYDGINTLQQVSPDGTTINWTFPPEAVGQDTIKPILIRSAENRLFLFNSTGRALRIRPTPGAAEPFKLEASFTHRIPDLNTLDRVWLDPAGRIILSSNGNTLSIAFPSGRIPPELSSKIPVEELKAMEE